MMAGTLNLAASRLDAENSSTATMPTKTITAPRVARRRRHLFRMRRMTSTSSARWSMSVPSIRLKPDPAFNYQHSLTPRTWSARKRLPPGTAKRAPLQKFLFSGQTVRNDGFGGQQEHASEDQIPPQ